MNKHRFRILFCMTALVSGLSLGTPFTALAETAETETAAEPVTGVKGGPGVTGTQAATVDTANTSKDEEDTDEKAEAPKKRMPAEESTLEEFQDRVDAFLSDSRWKNGARYAYEQKPKLSSYSAIGCCAYVSDFVKYVFDQNSPRSGEKFSRVSEIRAGDVLFQKKDHWLVVLERHGNQLRTCEGNWGSVVVVSDTAYSIRNNKLVRTGKNDRVFQYGYHYQ